MCVCVCVCEERERERVCVVSVVEIIFITTETRVYNIGNVFVCTVLRYISRVRKTNVCVMAFITRAFVCVCVCVYV